MGTSFETCGCCKRTWDSAFGAEDCPICVLVEKIDQHIESILLQILTSYYSKYIVEIDEKSAAWNREQGFSFRINRKHNLHYVRELENINLKNTYLLMAIPLAIEYAKLGAELTRDLNDLKQKNSKEYSLKNLLGAKFCRDSDPKGDLQDVNHYFEDFSASDRLKVDVKSDDQVRIFNGERYSHIESVFSDIQQAYKLSYGKNPSDVNT